MFCGDKSCSGGVRSCRGGVGTGWRPVKERLLQIPENRSVAYMRSFTARSLPLLLPKSGIHFSPQPLHLLRFRSPFKDEFKPWFLHKTSSTPVLLESPLPVFPWRFVSKSGISFCLVLSQVIPASQPDCKTFEAKSHFSSHWKKTSHMVLWRAQGFACHRFSNKFSFSEKHWKELIIWDKHFTLFLKKFFG